MPPEKNIPEQDTQEAGIRVFDFDEKEVLEGIVEAVEQAEQKKQEKISARKNQKAISRANKAYERNKRLLNDTAPSGLAGNNTLSGRGFVVNPQGGERLGPQDKRRQKT